MNCAAYLGGLISGVLDSANFPASVSAVSSEEGGEGTVFLIKFPDEVMDREARLG